MQKKLLAVLLALAVVLALAACQQPAAPAPEEAGAESDKIIIGFANLGESHEFFVSIRERMQQRAAEDGIELVCVDNEGDQTKVVQNADALINAGCQCVIEYNSNAAVNAQVKTMLEDAGVMCVALDIPCENENGPAVYVGNNNYTLGFTQGEGLAKICMERWDGKCDLYVSMETPANGETNEQRNGGILDGVRTLIDIPDDIVVRVDGKDDAAISQQVMADILTANPECRNIIVGCHQAYETYGVVAAAETANRAEHVIAAGIGPSDVAVKYMKDGNLVYVGDSCLNTLDFADLAYDVAVKLCKGEEVPQDNYIVNYWIDADNVYEYFPD